jgi:hypothetical protein
VASLETEELRIKRQDSLHVFVCPRLLQPEWFRHLYKASDTVFDVPAATSFWPSSMFEPLIIGIAFPLLSNPPGSSSRHLKCSTWEGNCAECGTNRKWTRGIFCNNFYRSLKGYAPCQQMWCGGCYTSNQDVLFHVKSGAEEEVESENNPHLQQQMRQVWGKKHRASNDFLVVRDGDHLLVPFECDLCIFQKLQG